NTNATSNCTAWTGKDWPACRFSHSSIVRRSALRAGPARGARAAVSLACLLKSRAITRLAPTGVMPPGLRFAALQEIADRQKDVQHAGILIPAGVLAQRPVQSQGIHTGQLRRIGVA